MALLFSVMLDSLKEVIWMNGILNQAKAIRSLCESHFERIKEKHALVVITKHASNTVTTGACIAIVLHTRPVITIHMRF